MTSQHTAISITSMLNASDTSVIDWLLAGDPAIAWQTQRDLLDAPPAVWQPLRQRTLSEGWGARLLALQDPDGGWGGGAYSPKWTSATYTLLTLCDIGVPPDCPQVRRGARYVLGRLLGEQCDAAFRTRLAACDRCIVGMLLRIAVSFGVDDPRIAAIVENLLAERMEDGGWNCRRQRQPRPAHSSFHTTLNVLEGLQDYLETDRSTLRAEVRAAEQGALELLLQHYLYRSDKTGAVIRDEWTHPAYPHRWHYDLLRGLACFAHAQAPREPRLEDAVMVLQQRRLSDGRWPRGKAYAGREFFRMEPAGPSRWNTLRALRVLRWWQAGSNAQPLG
jgi:hypothetical protein